jgi:hypothetical protein
MNTLELLVNAAKAAGINHVDYSNLDYSGIYGLETVDAIGGHQGTWNPLVDSRDAFKLAATLQISVLHFPECVEVEYPRINIPLQLIGSAPLVASVSGAQSTRTQVTRNLIVQVAANIGKYKA